METLLQMGCILVIAIVARIGWSLGSKLVRVCNLLLELLPYSIARHLWLE